MSECESCGRPMVDHEYAALRASHDRLLKALEAMMKQPTEHPLRLTPDQRGTFWAARDEARAAIAEARKLVQEDRR